MKKTDAYTQTIIHRVFNHKTVWHIVTLICCLAAASCREVELVVPTEYEPVAETPDSLANPSGLYLLNEGNMGSNKATIDFLDYRIALYARNIYPERNPAVVKELGDVGNDLQIYRDKLYAVINCSHKVEVMDARTGVRIRQIDIPNCRYIRFYKNYAYVSAYVAPVSLNPDAPKGAVYKINVNTLEIEDKVVVGYQPDELEIVDNEYIYVVNSGGYRAEHNYDNTISVIQIDGFKHIGQIEAGINMHRIRQDKYGKLWVSSRGNYKGIPSCLYVLDKKKNSSEYEITDRINLPCSNMAFLGDSLLIYSVEYNYDTNENTVSYAVVHLRTKQIVSRSFITDGTQADIAIPYGIAVHPVRQDIFVTDAKNYVSSGSLHCYTRQGRRKWTVRTGDIPAHIAFLPR